jgi:hypothetical protein
MLNSSKSMWKSPCVISNLHFAVLVKITQSGFAGKNKIARQLNIGELLSKIHEFNSTINIGSIQEVIKKLIGDFEIDISAASQ